MRSCLRGSAQVLFSSNAITGFIFSLAVFYGAIESATPSVGIGAVLGVVISTLTASLKRYENNDIEQGLFGYNGFLVGIAIPTFFESSVWSWILLSVLAILSTPLTKKLNSILSTLKISALTFPFVILTWAGIFFERSFLTQPTTTSEIVQTSLWYLIKEGFLRGFSQIFLVNNPLAGALILVGLIVASKRSALWGVIAAFISLTLSYLFHLEESSLSAGIFSYNSILTGIALGTSFPQKSWSSSLLVLLGVVLAMALQLVLAFCLKPFYLPNLTAPFVIATWLCLKMRRT